MNPLLGGLFVFVICPLLGGFPLDRLQHYFQRWQFVIEIIQGLVAVGVAKLLFPANPEWEIMALMGVLVGRYWMRQPGGIWSTIAGYMLHDPVSGLLVAMFGAIGTTLFRQNQQITFALLVLMPLMTTLRHSRSTILILLTAGLSGVLFGMEQKRPAEQAQSKLKLFRADSLNDPLSLDKAGQSAFYLSQLRQKGFPVPIGWILYPGDDPESLPQELKPSLRERWTVRSSFVRPEETSQVIGDLVSVREVWEAIVQHFESHARRMDDNEAKMSVIIQPQVSRSFGGIVDCQVPTLKADVPSEVAQQLFDLIDRLKVEVPEVKNIEWIYDGQKVWILHAIGVG